MGAITTGPPDSQQPTGSQVIRISFGDLSSDRENGYNAHKQPLK